MGEGKKSFVREAVLPYKLSQSGLKFSDKRKKLSIHANENHLITWQLLDMKI